MATGASDERAIRRRILRQSLSVALAVAPFGFVFGVACAEQGLSVLDAVGFSTFVFAGSSQFAAVGVLGDGGSAAAAITAGLLLNLRMLAFGVLMAPTLTGPWWQRALLAQTITDESTAVSTVQPDPRWRRVGFITASACLFTLWVALTIAGVLFGSAGDAGDGFVRDWGLDAAAPAAFLALLWPRLQDGDGRRIALAGAALAATAVPFVPAGLPILIGAFGVLAATHALRPGAER
jgi:4-azaleucine resistance transporter AzlC